MKVMFPSVPSKVLSQILGFMYFDQDGGYKAWNRNVVTQRLGNDRSYKISIESLLAELGKVDYEAYHSKDKSLEKVKNETTNFTELLGSIHSVDMDDDKTTELYDEVKDLNDRISKKELELSRVKDKRVMYSSSLRDQENFKKLLKKLSIKVKVGNEIVSVVDDNIVQDKHLHTRLSEYEKHYHGLEKALQSEVDNLRQKRDVWALTQNDKKTNTLFNSENSFKRLLNLLRTSGISTDDSRAATADI